MLAKQLEMVAEFHNAFGHPIAQQPTKPTTETAKLRHTIYTEEVNEFYEAEAADDRVEILDALCDCMYILLGGYLVCGIEPAAVMPGTVKGRSLGVTQAAIRSVLEKPESTVEQIKSTFNGALVSLNCVIAEHKFARVFHDAFTEVHRSNMSKLGANGKPIYRESDGKVLKGPNYSKPDLTVFAE